MEQEVAELKRHAQILQLALVGFIEAAERLHRATVAVACARPEAHEQTPERPAPAPKMAPNTLLNEKQAAEYLGFAPATLRDDRCRRTLDIPFLKLSGKLGRRGGRVAYRVAELDAWLAERIVNR